MNISRRSLLAVGLGGVPCLSWAQSSTAPAELASELQGARLQGQGRLTYFGLSVYNARLWVAPGFSSLASELAPVALELQYARSLQGRLIAERSLTEMQRAGALNPADAARWLAAMTELFPNVVKGDRITGVHKPGESARFYFNAAWRGEVREAEFAKRFFGIWLSTQTSEPALRQSLLGLAERPGP
jgi:hypothetical protein